MDVLVVRGGGESGGFVLRILSGGVGWRGRRQVTMKPSSQDEGERVGGTAKKAGGFVLRGWVSGTLWNMLELGEGRRPQRRRERREDVGGG